MSTQYPRQWTTMLHGESARWEQEGLITPEQRSGILALYPAPGQGERERFAGTLPILGALLVGAGVILWHAANWPKLPAWLKVAEIYTLILAAYGLGYHLQYRRADYPRVGQALIFLGALLHGAGIWLVAQIFHIDTHFPNGFLFWGLGVIPLAWITRSQPLLLLSAVVMTVWSGSEQLGFERTNWLFPVLAVAPLLPLAHRLNSWAGALVLQVGAALWLVYNMVPIAVRIDAGPAIAFTLMGLYGTALFVTGLALKARRQSLDHIYLFAGALASFIGLYGLTFEGGDHWARGYWQAFAQPHLAVLAGVLVLLLLASGHDAFSRMADRNRALVLIGTGVATAVALFLLPLADPLWRVIVANLWLFGLIIGLIYVGFRMHSALLVNLGLFTFVVDLITRYVDIFFDMLDRSLFFIIGGLLLVGGGIWLERNRREWMRDWGSE